MLRALLGILGTVLVVWSGFGALLSTAYSGDRAAEARFCEKYYVCDPGRVLDDIKANRTVEDLTLMVKRDPHFPFEWANLGDALSYTGRTAEAEHCFRMAVSLSPRWPPVLIRAVKFYFGHDKPQEAVPLAADIVDQVPNFDGEVFDGYLKHLPVKEVLEKGLPQQNPRPARTWLGFVIANGEWPAVQETWKWVTERGFADAKTTNEYVSWLVKKHPEEAPTVWRAYLGELAGEYGKSEFVFNGGFEKDFTGSILDWTYQKTPGVQVTADRTNPAEGNWCLRVQFDGEHNTGDTGLREYVVLPAGRYRFHVKVRTEGLSTDQGVRIQLGTEYASEAFLGTRGWTAVDIPVQVGQLKVVQIQLVRTPSQKFENKIQGTLWLDSVRIEKL